MGIFSKGDDGQRQETSGQSLDNDVVSEAAELDSAEGSGSPAELVALTNVQLALARVKDVDDVKEIRDKAEAVRKYIESAGLGLEVQNKAAELKLRAERKAGEMLAEMKLHGGDRRSDVSGDRTRLEDLGISKDQSSRWQLLARVPAKLFDEFVAQFNVRQVELTTAEALRFARRLRTGKSDTSLQKIKAGSEGDIVTLNGLITTGAKFGCIYAAPPAVGTGTLSVERICNLPVGEIAAEQSHLHLWTSNEQSNEAEQIITAWGFQPRDVFVWVKPKRGPGNYWRRSHELLMLGVRGECPFTDKSIHSWIKANRPRGGGKPSCIRELIEAVSPGPYVELFTDKTGRGWRACQIHHD